jgi:hypothetical protein
VPPELVTLGYETWTLSIQDVNSLFVFGRQTLRSVYGALETEERRRVRNNDELGKLIRGEDIFKYTRVGIKRWDILTERGGKN